MNRLQGGLGLGAVALLALGGVVLARQNLAVPRPVRPFAASPFAHADAQFAARPKAAKAGYEEYVAGHATSADPQVQDHVGEARMRLGYLAARSHDLPAARIVFLKAATVKGTGTMGAFGTVSDQAAYQAAVCLVGEGKRAEATQAFVALLKDRPLSPLARAAHRRLALLNGGATKPQWDVLLQSAVVQQEARVRFETSVCGPKCLERITGKDYKALAKLCGTTDDGTTVEGMRQGLKALGRESWAYRLNRQDLDRAPLPAILLQRDHYVVVERLAGDEATVWDPRSSRTMPWKLPPGNDPDFSATLILLAKPEDL